MNIKKNINNKILGSTFEKDFAEFLSKKNY